MSLGDTVHCIPFLRYLKQTFNCSITIMTRTCHKELADLVKEIDQVWTDEELLNQEPHEVIAKLKNENFTFFFIPIPLIPLPDKRFAQFIIPLTKQAHIPYRVGHKRIHDTLTHTIDITWKNCWPLPFSFYPFLLLDKLDIPFNITYTDIKKLSSLSLPKINLDLPINAKQYTLILHCGGTNPPTHWWPEHHYLSLCDLLKELPIQIILTGTQEEINTFPSLEKLPHVLNLKGKLSSSEMTMLVSKAQGLLSGCTGSSHLAAALGTTQITLFSNTKDQQSTMWRTLTTKNLMIYPSKICTLCETFNCHAQLFCRCMEHIDPHDVFKIIKKEVHSFS